MARILITGGAGFVGGHVARAYLEQGHEVAVIDDLSAGRREEVPEGARLFEGNIAWAEVVRTTCRAFRPEVVNHHAAQSTVRGGVRDPLLTYDTNIMGTANVLQAAQECGARRVIFASSGAVYGDCGLQAAPESQHQAATSAYGLSKWVGEELCHFSPLETVIFRYGNVYGSGQNPEGEAGVIAVFAGRLLDGKPVTVFGGGLQTRDYIHVGDVCRANVMALDGPPDTYNIGTGVSTPLVDVLLVLQGLTGNELPPQGAPVTPGDAMHVRLHVGKAYARLGFKAAVGLSCGLSDTVTSLRHHE